MQFIEELLFVKTAQPRSEQQQNLFILWLDEIFAFLRNLLASCAMGVAGIFTARNIHELPVPFPLGQGAPFIVGMVMAFGGVALALFSGIRFLLGLVRLHRAGKPTWFGWILLVLLWVLTVETVQITFVAVNLMNGARSVQGKP